MFLDSTIPSPELTMLTREVREAVIALTRKEEAKRSQVQLEAGVMLSTETLAVWLERNGIHLADEMVDVLNQVVEVIERLVEAVKVNPPTKS